jgi:hypothetical protein
MAKKEKEREVLSEVSNDALQAIQFAVPYTAKIGIEGVSPLLFHKWSCESIAEKAGAAKGSKAKKSDDINSYVWRNSREELCVPGEYLRQSVIHAAKYVQDPRSPRKSAMDLFKAGLLMHTELASLGVKDWDFLDQRRVVIQRNGITRMRPAMYAGWKATFELEVILPEYINRPLLQLALMNAGRLIGLGDFCPTYGRFSITRFD